MTEDVDLLVQDTPQNQRKLRVFTAELMIPMGDRPVDVPPPSNVDIESGGE